MRWMRGVCRRHSSERSDVYSRVYFRQTGGLVVHVTQVAALIDKLITALGYQLNPPRHLGFGRKRSLCLLFRGNTRRLSLALVYDRVGRRDERRRSGESFGSVANERGRI